MLFLRYLILFVSIISNLTIVKAQNQISNSGKEFWLAYGNNNSISNSDLRLYISSEQNTSVTVSTFYVTTTHSIIQNQTTEIVLNATLYSNLISSGISNKGISITSNHNITVFASNVQPATTDATVVLPKSALGKSTDYIINKVQTNRNSGVIFVANEDSTKILLTNQSSGPSEIILNKFQTYSLPYLTTQEPFSATSGNTCKPFSVFYFNECTTIGGCPACDHLFTQVLPNSKLGKDYILTPLLNQTNGYVYSILGIKDSTSFQINNEPIQRINRGQRVEVNLNNPEVTCIQASEPISVFQSLKGVNCNLGTLKLGDPALVNLNAMNQMIQRATFSSLTGGNIRQHYVNIVIDSFSKNKLYIDKKLAKNNKFMTANNCGKYLIYRDSINAGTHLIECENGFIAYAYGLTTAESYLFSVGSSFENQLYNFKILAPRQCVGDSIKVIQTGQQLKSVKFLQNNQIDSGNSVQYVFNIPGTYTIKMIAQTFENECPDTIIKTIEVSRSTRIFPNDTSFCVNYSKTIKLNRNIVSKYIWNIENYFEDTLLINKEGQFIVDVVDKNNCSYSDTFELKKIPELNLSASHSNIVCEADTIVFTNTSADSLLGKPIFYSLLLNDSIFDLYSKTIKIKGNDTGTYTFSLIAKYYDNCLDTNYFETKVLTRPNAKIFFYPSSQCENDNQILFYSDTLNNCLQCDYLWDFDDNTSSDSKLAYKSFDNIGTYTVKLSITHPNQCQDSQTQIIEIYPSPYANFEINEPTQCVKNNKFNAYNKSKIAYHNLIYYWDFGNSEKDTIENPEFKFIDTGNYKIILIVESEKGCKDSAIQFINIYSKPLNQISINNDKQCLKGNIFEMERIEKSSLFERETWSIESVNVLEHGPYLMYSFAQAGTYTYKYEIADTNGCADTTFGILEVYPQAQLDFITDTVCIGSTSSFISTSIISSGSIKNFAWDLGDGNTATGSNTSHKYNIANKYTIQLTTETDFGCKDTLIKSEIVKVRELPIASFEFNKLEDSLQSSKFAFFDKSIGSMPLVYDWTLGIFGKSFDPNPVFVFNDTASVEISLRIWDVFGCENFTTRHLYAYPENNIYIPNAFSPNNSLLNDNFKPVGVVYPKKYLFQIFDRWGSEIFRTNNPADAWDGKQNQSDMPEGVYMYRIWLISLQGQTQTYSGTVSLIR
jgi:gliding motility-associated-like protein